MGEEEQPEEMSTDTFKIGDLVWAKMKGYSPWPGKVSVPRKDIKRPKSGKEPHCIYFFGSNNFSWIEAQNIKPYESWKERLIKSCKTAPFVQACAAIEQYIETKKKGEIPIEDMYDDGVDDDEMPLDSQNDGILPLELMEKPSVAPKAKPGRKKRVSETNGVSSEPRILPKKRKSHDEKKSTLSSAGTSKIANHGSSRSKTVANFLDRPSQISVPKAEPVDVALVSQELKDKNIVPSTLKFGFLGLGIMGAGMAKNLLNSGHSVIVWNRSPEKTAQFEAAGAEVGQTPSDVIEAADITFSCVSDPQAAKDMVFGNCGVLQAMNPTKNYVEMTGIDPEHAQDISESVESKGGQYLEAQIQGSKSEAESGNLIIIAAGSRSLFEECASAFQAMAKHVFYVGSAGNASKINLALQLMSGVMLTGLAEGLALAERAGVEQSRVLEILKETSLASPMILEKAPAMVNMTYPLKQPLQHMQKDLQLALQLGHMCDQHLTVAASANEVFKHVKRLGYSEQDVAAVYYHCRF